MKNKFAIVKLQGKQYFVSEGDMIEVGKLEDVKNVPYETLLINDDKLNIGKPAVKDVKIKFKVVEEMIKGEKLNILKYKAKSRYRKRLGFRPQYTLLQVESIA